MGFRGCGLCVCGLWEGGEHLPSPGSLRPKNGKGGRGCTSQARHRGREGREREGRVSQSLHTHDSLRAQTCTFQGPDLQKTPPKF